MSVVLVATFGACGSDDPKRNARGDGGEAGETAASGAPGAAGSVGGDAGGDAVGGAAAGGTGGAEPVGEGGLGAATSSAGQSTGAGGDAPVLGLVAVSGQVVARNEQPVAGISVEIEGQTLVTDAEGRFATRATAPYDIVVRGDFVGGQYNSELYVGVTRANPKLYRQFVDENRSGGASGAVSGGLGFPQPAGHETRIQFGGPVLATFSNTLAQASNGTYNSSGDPYWLDVGTLPGVLFAVQMETATQIVKAVGSAPFTLVDGQTTTGGNVTLSAATLRDFTVDITAPGYTLNNCNVFFGPYGVTNASPPAQVTVKVPNGVPDQVGLTVLVSGTHSGGGTASRVFRLPGNSTGAEVTLAAPAVVVGPANNAQLPSNATFSFTRAAGTLAVVSFDYEADNGDGFTGNYVTVYTNGSSVSLSRLVELQLAAPPGQAGTWGVNTDANGKTVDDFVAPSYQRFDDVHSGSAGSPRAYTY